MKKMLFLIGVLFLFVATSPPMVQAFNTSKEKMELNCDFTAVPDMPAIVSQSQEVTISYMVQPAYAMEALNLYQPADLGPGGPLNLKYLVLNEKINYYNSIKADPEHILHC